MSTLYPLTVCSSRTEALVLWETDGPFLRIGAYGEMEQVIRSDLPSGSRYVIELLTTGERLTVFA